MRQTLESTDGIVARLSEDFVHEDKVVSRACCAGDCGMRLEEKVPIAILGDAPIDQLFARQWFALFLMFQYRRLWIVLTVPHIGLPCLSG